jgi:hypothetical protein
MGVRSGGLGGLPELLWAWLHERWVYPYYRAEPVLLWFLNYCNPDDPKTDSSGSRRERALAVTEERLKPEAKKFLDKAELVVVKAIMAATAQ